MEDCLYFYGMCNIIFLFGRVDFVLGSETDTPNFSIKMYFEYFCDFLFKFLFFYANCKNRIETCEYMNSKVLYTRICFMASLGSLSRHDREQIIFQNT